MSEGLERVVVIGGGLGAIRTVEALRRLGFDGSVTMVSEERVPPYDRPPLSKRLMAPELAEEPVFLRPPEAYGELCDLILGHRAVGLETQARRVTLEDRTQLGYDALVLAVGTRARRPGVLGGAGRVVRNHDDAVALRSDIVARGRLVVVGAGFMGCEIASAAAEAGVEVVLLESAPTPLFAALGAEVGGHLWRWLLEAGVDVRCGATVVGRTATPGGHRLEIVGQTGPETLDAPVVAVCVGAEPAVGWLADSGLEMDGAILCDAFGETSVSGVYAVGDAAAWRYPGAVGAVRVEHWTTTGLQAQTVAHNLLSKPAQRQALDPLHYFWSDQCGVKLQCFGLPAGADEVAVVLGDEERALFAVYGRGGRASAVLGTGRPKALMGLRSRLMAGASFSELVESLGEVGATSRVPVRTGPDA